MNQHIVDAPRATRSRSPGRTWTADEFDAACLALVEQHTAAERDLLELVLAGPRMGAAIAIDAGVRPGHFEQSDLKLIFIAADLRRGDLVRILAAARLALQADGHWDDTQVPGNSGSSSRWSDRSLCHFATRRAFEPNLIRAAADGLLDLNRRRQIVQSYLNQEKRGAAWARN